MKALKEMLNNRDQEIEELKGVIKQLQASTVDSNYNQSSTSKAKQKKVIQAYKNRFKANHLKKVFTSEASVSRNQHVKGRHLNLAVSAERMIQGTTDVVPTTTSPFVSDRSQHTNEILSSRGIGNALRSAESSLPYDSKA